MSYYLSLNNICYCMKKFRVGFSFLLLVIVCLFCKQFIVLINYLSALFLHELAHLYVAIKHGYSLKIIRLDIFGLSVELKEKINDNDNFAVNIAGPLCNLCISVVCLAIYWLVPVSYEILNTFCVANLAIAVFNLLPIANLDGGKIFSGFIKSDKVFKILDVSVRIILSIVFFVLFILSLDYSANYFYLLMIIFFVTCKSKREPTFSLFRDRNKRVEKVQIYKVCNNDNLYSLIKKIENKKYTVFYIHEQRKYVDEEDILELVKTYPLATKIHSIDI